MAATDIFILAQRGDQMLIGLILMVAVFWGFAMWGQHKDKRKRKDMLAAVKKNDRVMTVGGIIATVISANDAEVVLKIDESANVKITVTRSAIQRVLADNEKPGDVNA